MRAINADTELMRKRGEEIIGCAQEIEEVVNEMQRLINSLEEVWASEASTQFVQQFDGLKPDFIKAKETVEDIGRQLISIADAYNDVDTGIGGQMLTF